MVFYSWCYASVHSASPHTCASADQPIYIRNGSINFDRRDADERDPKILTYDDYIAELKEALIRKDASLDEINTIRSATFPSYANRMLTGMHRERMNVALESLAGCLSERIMENDDRSPAESEPRLSYLTSSTFSARTMSVHFIVA